VFGGGMSMPTTKMSNRLSEFSPFAYIILRRMMHRGNLISLTDPMIAEKRMVVLSTRVRNYGTSP
jgi:hypothetical protein